MSEGGDEQERESVFLAQTIDPIARAILGAAEPWDAYHAANDASGALANELDWMPHGGSAYVVWADLTDLYSTGKTPIPDAHNVLRRAAEEWLQRPSLPAGEFIEGWLARVRDITKALVDRDGELWSPPD